MAKLEHAHQLAVTEVSIAAVATAIRLPIMRWSAIEVALRDCLGPHWRLADAFAWLAAEPARVCIERMTDTANLAGHIKPSVMALADFAGERYSDARERLPGTTIRRPFSMPINSKQVLRLLHCLGSLQGEQRAHPQLERAIERAA